MYQRVKLYAHDGSNRKVNCYFDNESELQKFSGLLDHSGDIDMELIAREGIQRFSFPVIPGNQAGLKIVKRSLYPD
jgi:hypothetical protein